MFEDDQIESGSECEVCLSAHDEAIHEATVRIHQWFCGQVTHHFEDDDVFAAQMAI